MDHERSGHDTVTKSARWRAGDVYVLGSGELDKRAERDVGYICRSGGEERASFCAHAGPSACSKRASLEPNTANGRRQWANTSGPSAAYAQGLFPDGHGGTMNSGVF